MENIGKLFTGVLLIMLAFLIDGFVIMKIWEWILVPTFDIGTLSFSQYVGLSLIVSFTRPIVRRKESDMQDVIQSFLSHVGYDIVVLGLALSISIFI